MKQEMLAKVFDEDDKGDAKNDFLGSAKFRLSDIVSARGSAFTASLGKQGTLTITAVEANANYVDKVDVQIAADDLVKKNVLSGSDSYLVVSRYISKTECHELAHTEPVCGTLAPVWPPLTFQLGKLAGNNTSHQSVLVQVKQRRSIAADGLIGQITLSVDEMVAGAAQQQRFRLTKEGRSNNRGTLIVKRCTVTHRPTFVEYLQAGFQMNLAVSVDFTGSNGDPRDPRSLHFNGDPLSANPYVRAMRSVGEVLLPYDTDKRIAAFGFGASLMPNTPPSHFFTLTRTPDPYTFGLEGLLSAYSATLPTIRLSGPTNFAPTIKEVSQGARQAANVYTILLIITDGEITDTDDTVDQIVLADDAPLSIVIVGVGNDSDFRNMVFLDADNQALHSRSGRVSRRDIVQFVPFRKFENAAPEALAAEVLREIPAQFIEWAALANLPPPPRPVGAGAPPTSAAPSTAPPSTLSGALPPPVAKTV